MTKITYIPGEIANAAIDEQGNRKPVTRTQHIFDDAKGKSQAEVNKDVDDTLALHQSEINALNSQNYVTVDTFGELPATGAVDTVYRVANYDGTQVVTNKYAEYAWNGTQYKLLDVKDYGIDDEPTAGSDNLVKSGGVDKRILQDDIYLKAFTDVKRPGFIGSNGSWNNSGSGFCIPTEGIESIQFAKLTSNGVSYYAFLTEDVYQTGNLSYVSGQIGRIALTNTVITVPTGTNFIWFCTATGSATFSAAPDDFQCIINGIDVVGNFYHKIGSIASKIKDNFNNILTYSHKIVGQGSTQVKFDIPLLISGHTYVISGLDWVYTESEQVKFFIYGYTGNTNVAVASTNDNDKTLKVVLSSQYEKYEIRARVNGGQTANIIISDITNILETDVLGFGYAMPINGKFKFSPATNTLTPPDNFDIIDRYDSTRYAYSGGNVVIVNTGNREQLLLFNKTTGLFETMGADLAKTPQNKVILGIVDTSTGQEHFAFPYIRDVYDITEDGEEAAQISNMLFNNNLSYGQFIQDYVENKYWPDEETKFNSFVERFVGRQENGIYQIALVTDTHEGGFYAKDNLFALRTIALFNKVSENVDILMHGGDISCDYGTSINRYFAYLQNVMELFKLQSGKNFLITKGNHDTKENGFREVNLASINWEKGKYYKNTDYSSNFTRVYKDTYKGGEVYIEDNSMLSDSLFRFIQAVNSPDDAVWGDGAYYYYDVAEVKIRFVVANSFPVNDNGITYNVDEWKWFAQTALDLSEKATPTDWLVIVLRHTESTSLVQFGNIATAFMQGSSVTVEGETVNYGTLNGGGCKLVHLHGHEHSTAGYSNMGGYLDLGFRNASVEKSLLGNPSFYPLYVISVDTNNKKLIIDSLYYNVQTVVYDYDNNIVELNIDQKLLMARSGLSSQSAAAWTSSDTNVATVDSYGHVTGVAAGVAIITGTLNEKTVTYTVKVVN